MLKKLRVTQFVIIDTLDLDFDRGLTIFTGETGAGKSIILGAMGLILGDKARPGSIRSGADEATFEAVFAPAEGHPVWQFLIDKNLAEAGNNSFQINRTLKGDSEDEQFINQKPISQELLKEIGEFLVEIHGQTANHTLLGPENQLILLDMAGSFPKEVYDNVASALRNVALKKKELDEEKTFLAKNKGQNARNIEKIVKTFDDVGMKEGYIAKIQSEYNVLKTAKDTSDAFQDILGRMIASNGIIGALSGSVKSIESQPSLDPQKIAKLKTALDESLRNARVVVEQIGVISPEYEIDTGPLADLELKLEKLQTLASDAEIEFDGMENYWKEMKSQLDRIQNGRANLEKMKDELIQAKNDYRHHAHILTEKREEAGKELGNVITAEFAPLKLEKAEFRVQVEEKPEAPWTKLGFNEVTFLARMNPGQAFSPIAETASGGELARMILALKVVLQRVQTTSTLVFDEVDTGIGGAAAAAVGDRISLLSDKTQVIVITHSPQVASRGDQHYYISKNTDGQSTTSKVTILSMDERVHELSRMLAGDELTDESKAAAKRLIVEAENAVKARQVPEPPQASQSSEQAV